MEGWGGTHSRGLASGGFHPIPTDLTSNTIWARCTSCVGASWTIQRWIPEKVEVILAYLQLQLQGKVKVEFSFWGNTWLLIFSKQLIWYDIPASPLFSTSIALSPQWCSDCQEWGPPWTMTWVAKKDLRSIVKMIKKRRKWDRREKWKWWVDEYFNSFGLVAIFFLKSHLSTYFETTVNLDRWEWSGNW